MPENHSLSLCVVSHFNNGWFMQTQTIMNCWQVPCRLSIVACDAGVGHRFIIF